MSIKKLLRNKPFCNDLHFFMIAILLLCVAINHQIYVILLIVYLIFIFKKTKLILPILITILVFFISFMSHYLFFEKEENGLITSEYLVVDIKDNYLIIKDYQL